MKIMEQEKVKLRIKNFEPKIGVLYGSSYVAALYWLRFPKSSCISNIEIFFIFQFLEEYTTFEDNTSFGAPFHIQKGLNFLIPFRQNTLWIGNWLFSLLDSLGKPFFFHLVTSLLEDLLVPLLIWYIFGNCFKTNKKITLFPLGLNIKQ